MRLRHALRAFASELLANNPREAATSLALLLAAGLTEGVSLLVFIPALQLLQGADPSSGTFGDALGTVGIPNQLGPVLLLCVALVGVRALLVYAKNRYTARLHFRFADQLRLRLYRALGEARWSVTGARRSADIEDLLTAGVDRVQSGVWG